MSILLSEKWPQNQDCFLVCIFATLAWILGWTVKIITPKVAFTSLDSLYREEYRSLIILFKINKRYIKFSQSIIAIFIRTLMEFQIYLKAKSQQKTEFSDEVLGVIVCFICYHTILYLSFLKIKRLPDYFLSIR